MSNPIFDAVYRGLSGNSDEKVSAETQELRLAKCRACKTAKGNPMVLPTGNCRKCGCFVELKTEYLAESCPIGNW